VTNSVFVTQDVESCPSPLTGPLQNRPSSWPPPADFPVLVGKDGTVICRYGDSIWNVSIWAGKRLSVNFGDGPVSGARHRSPISVENANLLRQIAGWWLWGPRTVRSASTFVSRFNILRKIFVYCSRQGIRADQLGQFPRVADGLVPVVGGSLGDTTVSLLHDLLEQREELGFVLLDTEGMRRLVASLPRHQREQTPYIPPRIWSYQVQRLEAFFVDFERHKEGLESCYLDCLNTYTTHYGSASLACSPKKGRHSMPSPFGSVGPKWTEEQISGRKGSFSDLTDRHGITDLLIRWCGVVKPGSNGSDLGIRSLSRYFRMAGLAGTAYLLNFSMMRIEEAWSLRSDCLQIERDPKFGDIYLLRGETTKTDPDDDARWVACSKIKIAIESMNLVSRLRLVAAADNGNVPLTPAYQQNPHLVVRSYEPWSNSVSQFDSVDVRPTYPSYQEVAEVFPSLFDPDHLRIRPSDLEIARRVTPSLDPTSFSEGMVWPLSWHQLRRTGAVNMQASGLVSDSSVQYQLKHATRAMSLYYGHGYSSLRLNDAVRGEYLRTMYEIMGKDIELLFSDRFVSPHGPRHKAIQLKLVRERESGTLAKAAKRGEIAYKDTLLGGCTKRGHCEFGGVDNIARCGGGDGKDPCAEALYDREREPELRQLNELFLERLSTAQPSPYRESLEAQLRSVENALQVVSNAAPG